jgi:hypothetical protein
VGHCLVIRDWSITAELSGVGSRQILEILLLEEKRKQAGGREMEVYE